MVELSAHKRRVESMRPAEIIARQDAMVNSIDRRFAIFHSASSFEWRSFAEFTLSEAEGLRMTIADSGYHHFPDFCRAPLIRSPTGFQSIQSWRLISM